MNRIVPSGTRSMTGDMQGLHDRIRYLFACFDNTFAQVGRHLETCAGRGAATQLEHGCKRPSGLPSPGETAKAPHTRLTWLPLRAACRVMAHRDGPPQSIAQWPLQLRFP